MIFDIKKVVEVWKKVKLLLLIDIGIFDFLCKMLVDGMFKSYFVDLEKFGKKFDSFMVDFKVKVEKKVVVCLKQIQDDIKKYVDGVQVNCKYVMGDMDCVLVEFKNYVVEVISKLICEGLMKIWLWIMQLEWGGCFDLWEYDDDLLLWVLMGDWFIVGGLFNEVYIVFVKLLELYEKKFLFDFKMLLFQKIKYFGDMCVYLFKVWQVVGNIQFVSFQVK